ncbi:MAG: hypothetical protein SFZ03_08405 [Candidatus Melainabacteria bacterium]|nr:hypothetical protein [Candidatus Melainabacteria bacterium]
MLRFGTVQFHTQVREKEPTGVTPPAEFRALITEGELRVTPSTTNTDTIEWTYQSTPKNEQAFANFARLDHPENDGVLKDTIQVHDQPFPQGSLPYVEAMGYATVIAMIDPSSKEDPLNPQTMMFQAGLGPLWKSISKVVTPFIASSPVPEVSAARHLLRFFTEADIPLTETFRRQQAHLFRSSQSTDH